MPPIFTYIRTRELLFTRKKGTKMKHIFSVLMSIMAGAFISAATAQTVSLPYQMSFEEADSVELRNWVLNPGTAAALCKDQWIVGHAVHSAGNQALYISNNGLDAQFDSIPDVQYAYRDFTLPQGNYELSFEYLCVGAATSSMYAGWDTPNNLPVQAIQGSGTIPNARPAYLKNRLKLFKNPADPTSDGRVNGVSQWRDTTFMIQSTGATMRLVFAWANSNISPDARTIGACIDNIVIASTSCKRPHDITAEVFSCDSVLVSWRGSAASYELAYRVAGATTWNTYRNITPMASDISKAEFQLVNMKEGSYDFRVRSICSCDTCAIAESSAWEYLSNFVVFCPETHCVNFTDLNAPSVTCTYGTTTYTSGYYNDPANRAHAYDNIGVIDFGSDSKQSRHTTNWDLTAYDPRTGNALPLVPRGGYASVRLGNWDYNNGAESITYDYYVDESSQVLLMQYAIVLENPSGHDPEEMPRFVLEILDENGDLLDPTCGVRNFFARDADGVNWKSYGSGYDAVVYKPWTTVGLNLKEMNILPGSTIKVRLTTYDCFLSGHYGYAYFTLDCAKATIETASCAKDTTLTMNLKAPEGFKYQWYDKYGKAILGATTREFAPKDTATYRCRLTSTEEASCYFDLYSRCIPRLPVPVIKPKYVGANCRNRMTMQNNSFVRIVEQDTIIDLLDEKCDQYFWETWGTYADGTQMLSLESDRETPTFDYPDEGGHFFVKLTASLNHTCTEDTVIEIDIPAIRDYDYRDTTILCRPWNNPNQSVYLDEHEISHTCDTTFYYKTVAGCDSIIHWYVVLMNNYQITLPDTTICYGESVCVGDSCIGPGSPLYKSGKMWQWTHMQATPYIDPVSHVSYGGCDSIVMRRVYIMPKVKPVITYDGDSLDMPYHRIDLNPGQTTVNLALVGTGYTKAIMTYMEAGSLQTKVFLPSDSIKNLPINEYYFSFQNDHTSFNGCEVLDTLLVGGDTLCVTLYEQIQCDCGKPVFWIPFEKCQPANKALLRTCHVKFDAADKAAHGFEDSLFVALNENDTLRLNVPAQAEPGRYNVELIFDTIIGGCLWGQNAFKSTLTLTYDSSIIFHRWTQNAILSLKNGAYVSKANNSPYALYDFSEFQWYHNGVAVENANASYMQAPQLDNAGDYRLEMTRADGQRFRSCSYVPKNAAPAPARRFSAAAAEIAVSPTQLMAGEPIAVTLPEDAELVLFSVLGTKVAEYDLPAGKYTIVAPAASGIYILNARTREDQTSFRLQVK